MFAYLAIVVFGAYVRILLYIAWACLPNDKPNYDFFLLSLLSNSTYNHWYYQFYLSISIHRFKGWGQNDF